MDRRLRASLFGPEGSVGLQARPRGLSLAFAGMTLSRLVRLFQPLRVVVSCFETRSWSGVMQIWTSCNKCRGRGVITDLWLSEEVCSTCGGKGGAWDEGYEDPPPRKSEQPQKVFAFSSDYECNHRKEATEEPAPNVGQMGESDVPPQNTRICERSTELGNVGCTANRDSIVSVLRQSLEPLSLMQIVATLKSKGASPVYPSAVRQLLYSELLMQGLAKQGAKGRWFLSNATFAPASEDVVDRSLTDPNRVVEAEPTLPDDTRSSAWRTGMSRPTSHTSDAGPQEQQKKPRSSRKNTRICERCPEITVSATDRFCKKCKRAALIEMQADGYLQRQSRSGSYRAPEAQENTNETKHGTGHG
jgi:hypothetical protein